VSRRQAPVASVVLDNEAIQALLDPDHAKHRRMIAILVELNGRDRRRGARRPVVVPTAARVEAGWDRSSPAGAHANRLTQAVDQPLDRRAADRSTYLRAVAGVSVVDATVAQALEAAPQPCTVATSDVADFTRLRAVLDIDLRIVNV
jgi:hypothetical protein